MSPYFVISFTLPHAFLNFLAAGFGPAWKNDFPVGFEFHAEGLGRLLHGPGKFQAGWRSIYESKKNSPWVERYPGARSRRGLEMETEPGCPP